MQPSPPADDADCPTTCLLGKIHEFLARPRSLRLAQSAENNMATPNYQFEKRRRELDKKAKKEEKRRHKLEAGNTPQDVVGEPTEPAGDNPPPLDTPAT